jgi:hypothetical protein
MEILKVTKDIAIRTILFGSCTIPKVGRPVSEFSQSELIWAERIFSASELKAFDEPLWTRAGSGYGDGSGYGSGSGYGDGYGYGAGSGDGDGSGSGDGDGSSKDIGAKVLKILEAA